MINLKRVPPSPQVISPPLMTYISVDVGVLNYSSEMLSADL